jgi:hypothetical protein
MFIFGADKQDEFMAALHGNYAQGWLEIPAMPEYGTPQMHVSVTSSIPHHFARHPDDADTRNPYTVSVSFMRPDGAHPEGIWDHPAEDIQPGETEFAFLVRRHRLIYADSPKRAGAPLDAADVEHLAWAIHAKIVAELHGAGYLTAGTPAAELLSQPGMALFDWNGELYRQTDYLTKVRPGR